MKEFEEELEREWERMKDDFYCDCYEDRDGSDGHCSGCFSCGCHDGSVNGYDSFEEFRKEKIELERERIAKEFEDKFLK